jgi:hypothetical protein
MSKMGLKETDFEDAASVGTNGVEPSFCYQIVDVCEERRSIQTYLLTYLLTH